MTEFKRWGSRSIASLASAAVDSALRDAAVTPDDVDVVYLGNAAAGITVGQEMVRGQSFLRNTGLLGKPIINVENACASGSSAFGLAVRAVASGEAKIALAVGVEKLYDPERSRADAALRTAVDQSELAELEEWVSGAGSDTKAPLFMGIYSQLAAEYMATTGATALDCAAVAVKNRRHGALNPMAQFQSPVTVEEVLASRRIVGPLTLLMCCPIGDGAAALVVANGGLSRSLGGSRVRVVGHWTVSGTGDIEDSAVARVAGRAYEASGIGPLELDVVEVHDAAAPAELWLYEELGLCARGEGAGFLASGKPELGGSVVVNPSGGLISRGHPIGATGCAQLVELVAQLLGRAHARQVAGARLGLAENAGGFIGRDVATASVSILARE